jgi:hypothetical protein
VTEVKINIQSTAPEHKGQGREFLGVAAAAKQSAGN